MMAVSFLPLPSGVCGRCGRCGRGVSWPTPQGLLTCRLPWPGVSERASAPVTLGLAPISPSPVRLCVLPSVEFSSKRAALLFESGCVEVLPVSWFAAGAVAGVSPGQGHRCSPAAHPWPGSAHFASLPGATLCLPTPIFALEFSSIVPLLKHMKQHIYRCSVRVGSSLHIPFCTVSFMMQVEMCINLRLNQTVAQCPELEGTSGH